MPDIIIKLKWCGEVLISFSGALTTSTLIIEYGLHQGKDL